MGTLLTKLLSTFHSKHLEVVLVGLNNRFAGGAVPAPPRQPARGAS